MGELGDDQLMAKLAGGDEHAFRQLFERHAGHLLGYALRYLKTRAHAEDAAQEIWLKVIRLAPHYSGKGHFVAWLYTMTRNHCMNELRSQKRWSDSPIAGDLDLDNEELRALQDLPPAKSLESEILDRENWVLLKQKIDELPDNQRVALLLYAVEDLSYDDIAGEMNISVSAVKSLIFRARHFLGSCK